MLGDGGNVTHSYQFTLLTLGDGRNADSLILIYTANTGRWGKCGLSHTKVCSRSLCILENCSNGRIALTLELLGQFGRFLDEDDRHSPPVLLIPFLRLLGL